MKRLVVVVCLVLACVGSGPDRALRVLFIGNSLTASNDLPGVVEDLGREAGVRVETAAVLFPGTSLEDQWNAGTARERVAQGAWDFVVLQQGPSSLPESGAHLRAWTITWAAAIRDAGAEPALYMVWPEATRWDALPDVIRHYREAAEAVDGRILPAGEAFGEAYRLDPNLLLFDPDHFHPSPTGTLLAALVVYVGLTGVPPEDIAVPAVLQAAARAALTR